MTKFFRGVLQYLHQLTTIRRNCKLLFATTMLNGLATGIFMVVFNLYILSLGIPPAVLGGILSAGPFAQAIGSIPIGFLMEQIGFKKVFFIIYGVSGLARLAQVATPFIPLISISAFTGGLALSGDFVVRLPFLEANTDPEQRNHIYSQSSVLNSVATSIGALLGGFVPNLVQHLTRADLTLAYRYTLFFAGLLSLSALIPCLLISEQAPVMRTRKISLAPYLWGIDRFTVYVAISSLFVGVSLGLANPFMNIYYVYHLKTTREFFGTVSALAIIPALIATTLGPLLAIAIGKVRSVSVLRSVIPAFMVHFALTASPWLGTVSYWIMNACTNTSQPLSFAFAMQAAQERAKAAASAWLNVTFWLGQAVAAPLAGAFIGGADYRTPMFIAAGMILLAGVTNHLFFQGMENAMLKGEVIAEAS